ncbi:hypothetical protein PIB30_023413 [Stylosanthes scabra]|uniref:Uncharacterized protein n=1 Tax=Stylosanthes scabra TaxID=79078 RepID=A0ABU6X7G1_9FABA|nr:hypothetical protein [Stylosanthes scabra]
MRLGYVQELIVGGAINRGEEEKSFSDLIGSKEVKEHCYIRSVRSGLVDFDPVVLEAQIACNTVQNSIVPFAPENGPHKLITEPIRSPDRVSVSTDSCPYPPGFGLDELGTYLHDKIRAENSVEFVRDTPPCENNG